MDLKKLAYWTEHHQAWEASGVTQRVYCQREGLSLATFHYSRRLARDHESSQSKTTPVSGSVPQKAPLTLVPVRIANDAGANPAAVSKLTLRSPGGWQFGFSAAAELAALLPLLRQLP